jgi:hypothetical protein
MCHSDAGPVNVEGLKDAIATNEQHNSIVGGAIQGESYRPISCLTGKKKEKRKRLKIVFTLLWRLDRVPFRIPENPKRLPRLVA